MDSGTGTPGREDWIGLTWVRRPFLVPSALARMMGGAKSSSSAGTGVVLALREG